MLSRFMFYTIMFYIGLGCGQNNSTGPQHNQGDFVLMLPGNVEMAFVKMGTSNLMMGKYEVTQAQWFSILQEKAENISSPWKTTEYPEAVGIGDSYPAVNINVRTVHDFLSKLNELDPTHTYRLPSLQEWEEACLADTQMPSYWFTNDPYIGTGSTAFDDFLWHSGNSDGQTHEVGHTKPNPWGLYDMHGNVAEFINTWGNGDFPRIDIPLFSSQPTTYPTFAVKGGSYESSSSACRWQDIKFYHMELSWTGSHTVGFRVLRQLR